MLEVEYVRKEKAAALNYTVATEAAVIAALRPAMLKNGIVMAPVAVALLESGERPNKSSVSYMVRLAVTYRFTHVHSGDFIDCQSIGEAANTGDKGCAAAMTLSCKYALLQFFLLERGNDPDIIHEHKGERNEQEWSRAVQYIDKAATESALDNVMESVRTKAREHFSVDDLAEMAMYAERRRLDLRDQAAKR
jgi:hypothetical protein